MNFPRSQNPMDVNKKPLGLRETAEPLEEERCFGAYRILLCARGSGEAGFGQANQACGATPHRALSGSLPGPTSLPLSRGTSQVLTWQEQGKGGVLLLPLIRNSPGGVASVGWALSCKPKGCWFDSQWEHVPGLGAQSLIGVWAEGS